MNLIDVIPKEEYDKIELFYKNFAITRKVAPKVPLYDFLNDWAKSKKNLYTMLGGNLIYKIPYETKKSEDQIIATISKWMSYSECNSNLYDAFMDEITEKFDFNFEETVLVRKYINAITSRESLAKNLSLYDFKIEILPNKKRLLIPKGTRIFRALTKLAKYFDLSDLVHKKIEELRVELSILFNDNVIKGNLCFSIHPLDFMTMSDNNSNWSSCMSWWRAGAYRTGTVEMMNANNVICCYLENDNKYMPLYPRNCEDKYSQFWNDKKWRQLVYVNKDILLAGKAYPYQSEGLTKDVLKTLVGLLKENLNYSYKYGPELYNDMKKLDDLYPSTISDSIDNATERKHYTPKKIFMSTKAMYNDMLNDDSDIFWCYRNPIKHSKVISISGKTICTYCGDELIEEEDDYEVEYNDRYRSLGGPLCCYSCSEGSTCDYCGEFVDREEIQYFDRPGYYESRKKYCSDCLKSMLFCKDCGAIIEPFDVLPYYVSKDINSYTMARFNSVRKFLVENNKESLPKDLASPQILCLCEDCATNNHHIKYCLIDGGPTSWSKKIPIATTNYNKWEKYFI